MPPLIRCRKCGRPLRPLPRPAGSPGLLACSCGFKAPAQAASRCADLNPFRRPEPPPLDPACHDPRRAERETREIGALEAIATLVAGDLPLLAALDGVTTLVADVLQAEVTSLYLVRGAEVELLATHGFRLPAGSRVVMPLGTGITGSVAASGQPLALQHATRDPRYRHFPELGELPFDVMLAWPIRDHQGVLGVLNVNSTSLVPFCADQERFVAIVANLLAPWLRAAVTQIPPRAGA